MRVFVTGGTGFVGGAVVRRLLQAGHEVRALVRPGTNTRQLDGLPVRRVEGDLSDIDALRTGMSGCDWVFHVAALYSYWDWWKEFLEVNVEGTRRVLKAAQEEGVRRIVHTSSIAALGIPKDGTPGTEETPCRLEDLIGPYKRSKFLAEEVVREFVQQGLPAVIVNPSAPVGVGDHKPTATGQVVVDFLRGRMPAYVDTVLNMVDVDDVAAGHLLAAEGGRVGERYILGGDNVSLKQVLDMLAEISGLPSPRLRVPLGVALTWAYVDVALARLRPGRIPTATPDKVRIARQGERFDSSKAERELGYRHVPVWEALRKSVEWYRANGYAP